LTGRLPFAGGDALREKRRSNPPAPIDIDPWIPKDLDALCCDLMRRDPEERPRGTEVYRRLRGGHPPAPPGPRTTSPAPGGSPFVGRRAELEALWDAFRTMKQGRAVTVSVQGGSALGKSALVRRFLEDLKESHEPVVVLSGRCYERESVPYKALDSLIDALSQYLKRLSRAQADALLPHDTFALVRVFPVLRQVEAVARARQHMPDIPDSQEVRRRAFGALRDLFVRLADRRRVVLFIDDMQWGDADSAALLEALLRPPDPPVLLLIGCYRGEESETSPLLRVILPLRRNVSAALEGRDIVLGELPPGDSRDLAAALLAARDPAGEDRAKAIARESGGNPYFIEELTRFVQGAASVPPLAADGAPTEVTLTRVIEARVLRLPAPARRLLDVVAVAGHPIEANLACRAAELDGEGQAALAVLRSAHLVRMRTSDVHDEVETYHDRIREAVVADLHPQGLRDCHRQLTQALLSSGRSDPERLAAHFLGAGDTPSAAEYAAIAAAKAAEALAFDRAGTLYRFAITLRSEAGLEEGDLGISLADALANAGRGAEAAKAYLDAVPRATSAQAIDLHRQAAQQFLTSGHIEDGLRVLNTVLATLKMRLPETPRGALVSLLARRAWIMIRGLGFKARDVSDVSPHRLIRIDTCWSVTVGLCQVDMLRGANFQARHLLLALRAGEPYRITRALSLEIAFQAMGGSRSRKRTARVSAAARSLAERVAHPHTTGLSTLMEGVAAWLDGRWKTSYESFARAEAMLRERCTGVFWEIMSAQLFQLASLFYLGELRELSRRLPALLKEAVERGDLLRATFLRIGYCSHVAWLVADDPGQARSELKEGLDGWRRGDFDYLHIWARAAQTDISLYSGEKPAGGRVAERWLPFARSLNRFVQVGFVRGLESRARARLALAASSADARERDALLRGAERQAQAILAENTSWGAPLAQMVLAGVASLRGDAPQATLLLSQAEEGFAGADMALHATAARRRRAELEGDAGREGVAAADAWMSGQGIVSPARLTQMLAPGRWLAR
jgi:hypothetical protein